MNVVMVVVLILGLALIIYACRPGPWIRSHNRIPGQQQPAKVQIQPRRVSADYPITPPTLNRRKPR